MGFDWLTRWRTGPRWDEIDIWALDLEMSGLDPATDDVLSVGMVPIRNGVINYGDRFYSLVRPRDPARVSTDGLRAHHILPGEIADAPPLCEVVAAIDERLADGVLLVHFADVDVAFLRDAYRRCQRTWRRPRIVDSVRMLLALHDARMRWTPHPPPAVTALGVAREELGLPKYTPHHALSDALATAELFLALRSRMNMQTLRGT